LRLDFFEGRILLSVGPPPKLGESVIVTVQVQRTGFHLSIPQITAWLKLFGSVIGELKYLDHPDYPGVFDDTLEVLWKLRNHIPSPLPAFSKKLIICYKGQPIQCSRCMEQGHISRVCKSASSNWMSYVKAFVDNKRIPAEWVYLISPNLSLPTTFRPI